MKHVALNPAEKAAQEALDQVFKCISGRKNFRLEAGAGAGKTYSLIQALNLIIREQGTTLRRSGQQVACITYTNVATDEIKSRTDSHPVVHASTIHSFCWDLIRDFQPLLRVSVPKITKWMDLLQEAEGVEEAEGIGTRTVDYNLGHRRIDDSKVFLHHDDVLSLTTEMMRHAKFRRVITARFPILFIDEYQDTNSEIADSLLEHFIAPKKGPLIGLFGDSWQKIYGDGCGLIDHENLVFIGKKANFRSVTSVVDSLNRIRPDLPQDVKDPDALGSVTVFHTNGWSGDRRTGSHWKGDLPVDAAQDFLHSVMTRLEGEGWDFSPERTKILMLTHNLLASEQNYGGIAGVFSYNDSYIKKEDPYIAFLVDTIEPACAAYENGAYGEMLSLFGARSVTVRNLYDKNVWKTNMDALIKLRDTGTIGQVIAHLKSSKRLDLPDAIRTRESNLSKATPDEIKESRVFREAQALAEVPYQEVVSLSKFLNEHTPFSTKHGVKGAEFENVLVVFGRGWNHYNWSTFLEFSGGTVPGDKVGFYERNRNLFYVVCSRPKVRLALLFTQELSAQALGTLESWFGKDSIEELAI